jgi:hypothetical protein
MVQVEDIPEFAICHRCGKPCKVVFYLETPKPGVKLPDDFVFECCHFELTIEDDVDALKLRDLLLAYHGQREQRNTLTDRAETDTMAT